MKFEIYREDRQETELIVEAHDAYEGTVDRVRDVAADIRSSGDYPDHLARSHEGEHHVTLRDVTVTTVPNDWRADEKSSVVLLGHAYIWELL